MTSVSCGLSHSACTAEILPRESGVRNCMGCHGKFPGVKLMKVSTIYSMLYVVLVFFLNTDSKKFLISLLLKSLTNQ